MAEDDRMVAVGLGTCDHCNHHTIHPLTFLSLLYHSFTCLSYTHQTMGSSSFIVQLRIWKAAGRRWDLDDWTTGRLDLSETGRRWVTIIDHHHHSSASEMNASKSVRSVKTQILVYCSCFSSPTETQPLYALSPYTNHTSATVPRTNYSSNINGPVCNGHVQPRPATPRARKASILGLCCDLSISTFNVSPVATSPVNHFLLLSFSIRWLAHI